MDARKMRTLFVLTTLVTLFHSFCGCIAFDDASDVKSISEIRSESKLNDKTSSPSISDKIWRIHFAKQRDLHPTQQLREKRSGISDQRLVELETLLALKRIRDRQKAEVPIAYGVFDPDKIGRRRRRSKPNLLFPILNERRNHFM